MRQGLARAPAPSRRGGLLSALAVFACACAFVVQSPGWAQTSYVALTKALTHGTAKIDPWHWETHDISWYGGHYYSVKPPGLVLATLPLYEGLRAVGFEGAAHAMRVRSESGGGAPWAAREPPLQSYGFSRQRALAAREVIADSAPMIWALGLLGVLVPALALLVLVARLTNKVAPGTGTATALTLGTATMILPFSTLYFSHVLSALLVFAAFALAWREREREGPPRPLVLAVAGLLAGFAIVCEYPLAIAAIVVGAYAVLRAGRDLRALVRRAVAYGAGLAAGVAPLLAYQWWAFGSPLHTSYVGTVAETGYSGHDVLGLNDPGVFGITLPRIGDGLALLFSGRGLLTLTPVLVLAIAGVVALHRDGRRAEARTIAAVALAYLVYNAGYWLPFGGGSPGPRFLIPVLAFLALGLGPAWRRWPAVTLALTAISATTMVAATMSYPMIGSQDPGEWVRRMVDWRLYQHSVLDFAGIAHGLGSILPFVGLVAIALTLGLRSLGRRHLAIGANRVPAAVAIWALCAIVLPRPGHLPSGGFTTLIATASLIALAAVAVTKGTGRRRPSAKHEEHRAPAPLTLEVQSARQSG
ncbi:MAG: hypothetical protein QOJ35_1587 [Solirubrobacteraceae bacterium]|nr:hypothetical protein [Solirubrobacteraceae bacterium]